MKLIVEPRKVISWQEFCAYSPNPFEVGCNGHDKIALDGFVSGAPKFDSSGPCINFNHHEDVNRIATRCTASQVHLAIKLGLIDSFNVVDTFIYVNDCDQDVCLSVWLLKNHDRVKGLRSEPALNRILNLMDILDTCAGAYPIAPDSDVMQEIAWITQPYTRARTEGRIAKMNESEMEDIIDAVGIRISQYSIGRGERVLPDTRHNILHQGKGWVVVEEIGPDARTAMLANGIKCFIAKRGDVYSIGKMSPFVSFDLSEIYKQLNCEEFKLQHYDPNNQWGGSDTIGGSPRATGTKLSMKQIIEVATNTWEQN